IAATAFFQSVECTATCGPPVIVGKCPAGAQAARRKIFAPIAIRTGMESRSGIERRIPIPFLRRLKALGIYEFYAFLETQCMNFKAMLYEKAGPKYVFLSVTNVETRGY